jgi:hypothetical protein
MSAQNHFWVGSLCYANARGSPTFPGFVIATADIIKPIEDLGNNIPDRSWMLYLLELFNQQNIAVELNLICEFNDKNNFWAIYSGANQYRFTKVLPIVGHSYNRQIVMFNHTGIIQYSVRDLGTGESETFELKLPYQSQFYGINNFTGIEWWNRSGDKPFPLRYKVEISQLMYGQGSFDDPDSVTFRPFNILVPNSENSVATYPIAFEPVRIIGGYISYIVGSGNCHQGPRFYS